MSQNVSLAEYISQTQRGLTGRIFGPDFMKKSMTTGLNTSATTYQNVYGRKVWDALNNRTVMYNALKKVAWGNTAGWVLRTDRGSGRMRAVTETGSLPTIDVSNYTGVYTLPKIIAADFGVPIKSIVVNTLEGGMGDILATELQATERDFVKGVNQMIMSGSAHSISAIDTAVATAFTVPTAVCNHFQIGDQIGWYDLNNTPAHRTTSVTVSSVNSSTGVVQLSGAATDTAGSSTNLEIGDVVYVIGRAGLTSLDDLIAENDELVGAGKADTTCYNLTVGSRTSGTYAAGAYVSRNTGVGRALSLNLIDTCIQKVRERGGEPKLITMGWDQYFNLERLLNAHQRYLGQETFQVGVGDERTLEGTRTGLILSTYMGIPILPDPDCAKSSTSSGVAALGSNVYVLDTDYMEIAVAMQPQYIENRDFFAATAMVVRGLIYMMAETRCTRFDVQAKIADLSA